MTGRAHAAPSMAVAIAATLTVASAFYKYPSFTFATLRPEANPPASQLRSSSLRAATPFQGTHHQQTFAGASVCTAAAAAAVTALLGSVMNKRRKAARKAFSSSSSGFMGTPIMTTTITTTAPPAEAILEEGSPRAEATGVAGMTMNRFNWWNTKNGQEGRTGRIFHHQRRENRRIGEEDYRHDVDNFEMTLFSLIDAPGAWKKRIRRGRGQYHCYGRKRGLGKDGRNAHHSNKMIGFEGNNKPIQRVLPKLTKQQMEWMKQDPYTHLDLDILDLCDDGEELEWEDVYLKGFPVKVKSGASPQFKRIKVTDKTDVDLSTKNLTIYAHAFVPSAQEKIENNGGKCVRLDDETGVPVDESFFT